jgi:multidrug resistance efflux pump
MIEPQDALESLNRLRAAIRKLGEVVRDAKEKARIAKYKLALAVVRLENANTATKVPATVRKEHALTDPEVQEAIKAQDEADARLIVLNAECDWDKERIMLFKTMVKEGL